MKLAVVMFELLDGRSGYTTITLFLSLCAFRSCFKISEKYLADSFSFADFNTSC